MVKRLFIPPLKKFNYYLNLSFLMMLLLVNSCKKELYTSEKIDLDQRSKIMGYLKEPKIETVSMATFTENVNLSSLGVLKEVMLNSYHTSPGKLMGKETGSNKTNYKVNVDSAKLLVINGQRNYIFSIAPVNPRSVTFRNLTVSINGSTVIAFLTSFTPTRRWAINYKLGKKEKFRGRIVHTPINLNDNDALSIYKVPTSILPSMTNRLKTMQVIPKTSSGLDDCIATTLYEQQPYYCASGHHGPGDLCYLEGADRAGYTTVVAGIKYDCYGGGGSNGGGGTIPGPPPGYNPCSGVGNGSGDESTPGDNQVPGGEIDVTICTPLTPAELNNNLDTALANNPNILIDCETAQAFLALSAHRPPQSVYSRISDLNNISNNPTLFSNPYFVQQIQNANGFQINLDRFEININTLPIVAGARLTPTAFLNYIRLNLNNFIDNNIATFQPYSEPNTSINDAAVWNSASPLGSILHLDMADNGSVIVSDYAWNKWTVSTLRTPIDGAHPVSGNRSWGYDLRASGGYTFYVTGSDRITRGLTDMVQLLTGVPFNAADQLWQSYQTKVSAFVNSHSGSATIGNKITERPNYVALKDYFDGKITLNQLKTLKGCN